MNSKFFGNLSTLSGSRFSVNACKVIACNVWTHAAPIDPAFQPYVNTGSGESVTMQFHS